MARGLACALPPVGNYTRPRRLLFNYCYYTIAGQGPVKRSMNSNLAARHKLGLSSLAFTAN